MKKLLITCGNLRSRVVIFAEEVGEERTGGENLELEPAKGRPVWALLITTQHIVHRFTAV